MEAERAKMRAEEQELRTAKADLESAALANGWEVDGLKEEVSTLTLERDQAKSEVERLREELEGLKKERETSEEAGHRRQSRAASDQLQSVTEELDQVRAKAEEESDALRREVAKLKSDNDVLVQDAAKLQKVADEMDPRLQEEKSKAEAAQISLKMAQEELRAAKDMESMRSELDQNSDAAKRQLQEMADERDSLVQAIQRSKDAAEEDASAANQVQSEIERLKAELDLLRGNGEKQIEELRVQLAQAVAERDALFVKAKGVLRRTSLKSVKFAEPSVDPPQPHEDADAEVRELEVQLDYNDDEISTNRSSSMMSEDPGDPASLTRGQPRANTWAGDSLLSGPCRASLRRSGSAGVERGMSDRQTVANGMPFTRSAKRKSTRSFGVGKMWRMNVQTT
eukprot:CAMPEP_0178380794 /NCGR_PEP_ID=MMETSP0689_2-20121128/5649_1 /TAXON_ID=160604 /ORGANISM="Amphidinium massartii, Strain CS-259" /LENGTH=397 /DNA_ID=CAMNT_0020000953 /DNA_START=17 /DNA_END=1212 /DNA_ORIENTATION=-